MKISMICCPFQTSFGMYGSSLKSAIEDKTGTPVQWVASNCGCGDPIEVNRIYQAKQCDYFEMPVPGEYKSSVAWKRHGRQVARSVFFAARARKFATLSRDAEVVHFQQVLNAYGSKTVFSWLKRPSTAIRVVTVHELDSDQTGNQEGNLAYNRANAVIVHCQDMKDQLVRLKVRPEKIRVVLHGTMIPQPSSEQRRGIVFYGGHKLMTNKGLVTLMTAMAIIKKRMGADVPTLSIHGHYGTETPSAGLELAEQIGVTDSIVWRNQMPEHEIAKLYQRSLLCVLPYTGSFAGGAAALAAACGTPVVCTRKAGLPDHLGDTGIWIEENNAEQLAERVIELLKDDKLRSQCAARAVQRAQDHLRWDVIAEQTLRIYRGACHTQQAA
jgi:glycosyltransferase involved in cell wall biosynthesis